MSIAHRTRYGNWPTASPGVVITANAAISQCKISQVEERHRPTFTGSRRRVALVKSIQLVEEYHNEIVKNVAPLFKTVAMPRPVDQYATTS
jgi:hypothetical protein